MRLVVSLLTAVCFIAAADVRATGVPRRSLRLCLQHRSPAPIDIIRQGALLCQKLAGNRTTGCQWIDCEQFCSAHCF
jgi:hypothetical protein